MEGAVPASSAPISNLEKARTWVANNKIRSVGKAEWLASSDISRTHKEYAICMCASLRFMRIYMPSSACISAVATRDTGNRPARHSTPWLYNSFSRATVREIVLQDWWKSLVWNQRIVYKLSESCHPISTIPYLGYAQWYNWFLTTKCRCCAPSSMT